MLVNNPHLEIYKMVKFNVYIGIETNNYLTMKHMTQSKQT